MTLSVPATMIPENSDQKPHNAQHHLYHTTSFHSNTNDNRSNHPIHTTTFTPPPSTDLPAVIVAYQDITSESVGCLVGHHPDNDLVLSQEKEESFCSNFVCCGQFLPDLHTLIQHYEDCHVRFEASPADLSTAGGLVDYNNNNNNNNSDATDQSARVGRSPRNGKRRRMLAVELEQCDFLTDDTNVVSAFDNTVLRTITAEDYNPMRGGPSRSQSVPAASVNYSKLSNLSGHPSESLIDQCDFIRSILSTTVDHHDNSEYNQLYLNRSSSNSSSTSLAQQQQQQAAQHLDYLNKSDRPYICRKPGCGKAYKNPNGLKYHEKHGHDEAAESVERPYRCVVPGCGKQYKNPNGLKYHMEHAHANFVRHLGGGGNNNSTEGTSRYLPVGNTQRNNDVVSASALISAAIAASKHNPLK